MPMVGRMYVREIHGLPECSHPMCRQRVNRRAGSIQSAYCRDHYRDELDRRMAGGLSFAEAHAQLWQERPRVRLEFAGCESR